MELFFFLRATLISETQSALLHTVTSIHPPIELYLFSISVDRECPKNSNLFPLADYFDRTHVYLWQMSHDHDKNWEKQKKNVDEWLKFRNDELAYADFFSVQLLELLLPRMSCSARLIHQTNTAQRRTRIHTHTLTVDMWSWSVYGTANNGSIMEFRAKYLSYHLGYGITAMHNNNNNRQRNGRKLWTRED